jgi:hypothetical protein
MGWALNQPVCGMCLAACNALGTWMGIAVTSPGALVPDPNPIHDMLFSGMMIGWSILSHGALFFVVMLPTGILTIHGF